jgi:hypothetical protein
VTTSPTRPPVGTCRSCRAKVVWTVVNPTGKPMQVDAGEHDDGNVLCEYNPQTRKTIATVHGGQTIVMAVGPLQWVTRSHFVTCPQAKEWRHKK